MSTMAISMQETKNITKSNKKSSNEKLISIIRGSFPFWFRIKHLLETGADPNANIKIGDYTLSALHIAAYLGLNNIVAVLLNAGANPNVTDEAGRTPFLVAIQKGNIATLTTLLNQNKECIHQADTRKWGVLHYAVAHADATIVSFLRQKGADVSAKNKKEKTALDFTNKIMYDVNSIKDKQHASSCKKQLEKNIVKSEEKNQFSQMSKRVVDIKKEVIHQIKDVFTNTTKQSKELSMNTEKNRQLEFGIEMNKEKYSQRIDAERINGYSFTHNVLTGKDKKLSTYEVKFTIVDGGLMARKRNNKDSRWEYLNVQELPTHNEKTKQFVVTNNHETVRLFLDIVYEDEIIKDGVIRKVKNYYVHETESLSQRLQDKTEQLEVISSKNTSGEPTLEIKLDKFALQNINIRFPMGTSPVVKGPAKHWQYRFNKGDAMILFVDDCVITIQPPPDDAFEDVNALIMSKNTFLENENGK